MNTYIHIGMPKAASTTLQKHFFDKHPQIFFVDKHLNLGRRTGAENKMYQVPNSSDVSVKSFYRAILNDTEFDLNKAMSKYQRITSHKSDASKITVLSHESFLAGIQKKVSFEEKARRIHAIIPDGKILVIIRNQLEYIKSHYRMLPFDPGNIHKGKPVSIKQWVDIAFENEQIQTMEILKYDKVYQLYAGLFGPQNVLMLCMESLREDVREFTVPFSSFLNIDPAISFELLKNRHENVGISKRMNMYRRISRQMNLSGIFSKILNPAMKEGLLAFLRRGEKDSVEMPQETIERIREFFGTSNSNIEKTLHLPLSQYDYPLAHAA